MLVQRRHENTAVTVNLGTDPTQYSLESFCDVQKVLRVRRQIKQHMYNLEGRLDAILERILKDLSPGVTLTHSCFLTDCHSPAGKNSVYSNA